MPNAPPSHPRRREEALMAALFSGSRRGGVREICVLYLFLSLRHKRQPMCSRLVCDSGVMNVTAVIRASAVSVLDIHENDGI